MTVENKPKPWVLGISCSHNGAACLLRGNEIVAAIQEEQLTRVKRQRIHGALPSLAIAYCLQHAGIKAGDLDLIAYTVQEERPTLLRTSPSTPYSRRCTIRFRSSPFRTTLRTR